nr:MAG TPA: hypothetical protein [Caudoviricetes sp.]
MIVREIRLYLRCGIKNLCTAVTVVRRRDSVECYA